MLESGKNVVPAKFFRIVYIFLRENSIEGALLEMERTIQHKEEI